MIKTSRYCLPSVARHPVQRRIQRGAGCSTCRHRQSSPDRSVRAGAVVFSPAPAKCRQFSVQTLGGRKVKAAIRNLSIIICAVVLTACASTPKVALSPEAKQGLKRIAVVQTTEPEKYFVYPGQLPGGFVFYMFGAIGGAVIGGIEASRIESATTRFTTAVSPLQPDLSGTLLSGVEEGLRAKGYEIHRVPAPPMLPDGKAYDLSRVDGPFDAVLVTELRGGYVAEGKGVAPSVTVSASLMTKSGSDRIFATTYTYSPEGRGEVVQIEPDENFVVASVDAIYDDVNVAVEGLRTGARKVAERMVADL